MEATEAKSHRSQKPKSQEAVEATEANFRKGSRDHLGAQAAYSSRLPR